MNIYHFASNRIKDVKRKFIEILSGIYSPNECEVLFRRLGEHLGIDVFNKDFLLNQSELIELSEYIRELEKGKPIEYILGYSYFFNLKFYVNEDVLIPRPETEEMVYLLKNIILKQRADTNRLNIIDIGTGSGCIAITLKKIFLNAEVYAVDISEKSLAVAKKNADEHQVQVHFGKCDVLSENLPENNYDIIVSNPPYIPVSDECSVSDRVKKYEPSLALFSNKATDFYERVFDLSKIYLKEGGLILMELNQYYANDILKLAKSYDYFAETEIIKDWSSNDRFIKCIKV
ncbi:MAG: peptide chain release factor N(5)-glutamine methyltransferase [Bacteroidia bacterium]